MKKRICFVTTYYDFSRARMLKSYEKMLPKDVEIFLVCQKNEKIKFKTTRVKKFEYSSKKPFVMFELNKFCKKNKIDILTNLSGGPTMALTIGIGTIFNKTKNIFYDHGNPKKKNMLILSTFQLILDKILVCSPDFLNKIKKYLFLRKHRIFYLPIPTDTNFFKQINNKTMRTELNIKLTKDIIISVGRIEYQKGSDFLLKLIKNNPKKKFILVSNNIETKFRDELKNLKNYIILSNISTKELIKYYNIADICVLLSRSEGLSYVPRESMACGTPCIVSDIESLRLMKPAIKVPFEINTIQNNLDKFFNLSNKKREELSKKSREFIVENFSEETLKKNHIKYLLD